MTGELKLEVLISSMRPMMAEGEHVFVSLPLDAGVPDGLKPVMIFEESEGTTLIVRREAAEAAGLAGLFPCRMITLKVYSSLEAVGFLAAIATRLAAAGIGVNLISAFYHDHLFVPTDRAEEALDILRRMARGEKLNS